MADGQVTVKKNMAQVLLAADGLVLTPGWILGVLAGAGSVIALLFKLLIASKDREIDRMNEDFDLFKEQVKKDELRREKEDERVALLIDEVKRFKNQHGKSPDH